MERREIMETYLQMLNESLQKKLEVLDRIYELTEQQDLCFQEGQDVIEVMERCVSAKEALLARLAVLDEGFDSVYSKIKDYVIENTNKHKEQIAVMQSRISATTSLSVKIQTLEQSNKRKLELFLSRKKNEIRQFTVNSRTASNYYKNMTGKHQGESYFIDKKK